MQAVILAGGLGTRLRPITETIPKALAPVRGRPFLEYQLEVLAGNGIDDVIICLGYLGHMIEDHFGDGCRFGVSIRYGYERGRLLGTAGAVKNVEHHLQDVFFVLNGDTYTIIDFVRIHEYFAIREELGLMVVLRNDDRSYRSNVEVEAGLVRVYDRQERLSSMAYVDCGAWLFRRAAFSGVPLGTPVDMSSIYHFLIRREQLLSYEIRPRFYDIGTPEGLHEFEAFVGAGGPAPRGKVADASGHRS